MSGNTGSRKLGLLDRICITLWLTMAVGNVAQGKYALATWIGLATFWFWMHQLSEKHIDQLRDLLKQDTELFNEIHRRLANQQRRESP